MTMHWPQAGQITLSTNDNKIMPGQNSNADSRIQYLRMEIDSLDNKLTQLLLARFELAKAIANEKDKAGLPIRDGSREQALLERISGLIAEQETKEFISEIFKEIMEQSVAFQLSLKKKETQSVRAENSFPNVCLIGAGLIGGALARQIKSCIPESEINAIDRNENVESLRQSPLFKSVEANIEPDLIKKASLVVIACSPERSLDILRGIAPHLSSGQIVMDVCSTKAQICSLAEHLDLNGAEFIGGHPFFGSEKQGFDASADLELNQRTFCLVPTSKSSDFSLARLRSWLSSMNFQVFSTNAHAHDKTVALTSHLIQLFASALGSAIFEELVATGQDDHLILSGGAFAGLSRLMNSPSAMWREVVGQNSGEISRLSQSVFSKIMQMSKSSQEGIPEGDSTKNHSPEQQEATFKNGLTSQFNGIFEQAKQVKSLAKIS